MLRDLTCDSNSNTQLADISFTRLKPLLLHPRADLIVPTQYQLYATIFDYNVVDFRMNGVCKACPVAHTLRIELGRNAPSTGIVVRQLSA